MSIVREHKGTIRFHSRVGLGTQFQVYLPLTKIVVQEKLETAVQGGCDPEEIGGWSILLFDDDPYLLEINKEILECLGI